MIKLTIEQYKKANSILRKTAGYRNANILVPEMLNTLSIKYSYDKDNNYLITIDRSHIQEDDAE